MVFNTMGAFVVIWVTVYYYPMEDRDGARYPGNAEATAGQHYGGRQG
jgi:hypothetical protein